MCVWEHFFTVRPGGELRNVLGKDNSWLKPSLQEWLETDGRGGFSSSTSCGIHTRRYHGWLFLAGKDPGERWLALSKIEDTCTGPDGKWELSSNLYPGSTHPDGIRHLWAFSKEPFPRFIFRVGKGILQREIFMVNGMPGVFCIYSLTEAGGMSGRESRTLVLRPLCNSRFYHHTVREGSWNPRVLCRENAVVLEGHSAWDSLALVCTAGSFTGEARWYRNMIYPLERERGLDYTEDHLSPGYFTCQIKPGEDVVLWAGPVSGQRRVCISRLPGTGENVSFNEWCQGLTDYALRLRELEVGRRRRIQAGAGGNKLLAKLYLAADQFIVKAKAGTSIIAGYHWFGEWGRDTFISLPGLLLNTRRFSEAKDVFMRFAGQIQGGLVPNCFVEGQGAAYNSVDASLWFIDALAKYEKVSGDWEFVKQLIPKIGEIIDNYITGTGNGIKMHSSGLLRAGNRHSQLTWMDARADGVPATPRDGFPVEVNALWIRALSLYGNWLKKLAVQGWYGKMRTDMGSKPGEIGIDITGHMKYSRLALKAAKQFRRLFIWPGAGLYDRIDEKGTVPEIRPNQLIAGSITELFLPRQALVEIWATVFDKLLSPHGIRTLAPFSTGYQGRYAGGPRERDGAYHQGTAWPWLFGPLFDLSVRLLETEPVFDGTRGIPENRPGLTEITHLLLSHVLRLDNNTCIGTIFEVASGDPPFEAGGTVSQAWSVSEAIRILSFLDDTAESGKPGT